MADFAKKFQIFSYRYQPNEQYIKLQINIATGGAKQEIFMLSNCKINLAAVYVTR